VNTASSIAGVSLPVNVFCWLGWKQPTSLNGPTPASAPCPYGAVPRERAERDDHTQIGQRVHLAFEERQARVAFPRRRSVRRRSAAVHRRDERIVHAQSVVAGTRRRPVRESAPVKRCEQEVA
jgi:hypothetical protein